MIKHDIAKPKFKHSLHDIIPAGYEALPLTTGDRVKVIIDSQFEDNKPRSFSLTGTILAEDNDAWGYCVKFVEEGNTWTNWHKRYHLKFISH